jgi:hypothetical protein
VQSSNTRAGVEQWEHSLPAAGLSVGLFESDTKCGLLLSIMVGEFRFASLLLSGLPTEKDRPHLELDRPAGHASLVERHGSRASVTVRAQSCLASSRCLPWAWFWENIAQGEPFASTSRLLASATPSFTKRPSIRM